MNEVKISKKLFQKVKLSPMRQYKIANLAGLTSSTLSRLLCGIDRVKNNDSRILSVGKVLGLSPKECFEDEEKIQKN